MGCYGGTNVINFNGWLSSTWGAGQEFSVVCAGFYGASNFVFGQNPPYYLDDFKSIYPKFFGLPTALSGCVSMLGSTTIAVPNMNGLDYGQFVQAFGVFPKGTVIVGLGNNTITLNNAALVDSSNFTVNVYQFSPIPTGVILMYLNLAVASLVQARWQEMWFQAIGLFIAHYCTLYAKSDASEVFERLQTAIHGEAPVGITPGTAFVLSSAPPGGVLQALTKNGMFMTPDGVDYTLAGFSITMAASVDADDTLYATWPVQVQTFTANSPNGAQIAAQGLSFGIMTSKSVGDVSVGYSALTSLEDWGSWNLTSYGQLLATQAKVIGMGPALIW